MPVIRTIPIGRPTFFYTSGTSQVTYTEHQFGFDCNSIIFVSDTGPTISISLDGNTLAGEIKNGEVITFSGLKKDRIYERGSGTEQYRIWSY